MPETRWLPEEEKMQARAKRYPRAAALACLCLAGAGWLADLHADTPAPKYVRPASVLLYSVDASPSSTAIGFAWQLHVGDDGTVNLGPYGTITVAGLTFEEAKAAIDKQIGLPQDGSAPTTRERLVQRIRRHRETRTWAEAAISDGAGPDDGIQQVAAQVSSPARPQQMDAKRPAPAMPRAFPPPSADKRLAGLFIGGKENVPAPTGNRTSDELVRTSAALPVNAAGKAPAAPPPMVRLSKGRTVVADVPDGPTEYRGPDGRPAPHECAAVSLPPYIIGPPDILLVESIRSLRDQPIRGQHLVRPDGTIGLGIYGSVYVAGLTLEQAQAVIAHEISKRVQDFDVRDLSVDVLAYNSKVYYVITDGGGFGEQVYRLPITGHETVLDAIAQINGLPPVASKKHIWVARPCAAASCGQMILPVDWKGITCDGLPETNYQLFPGDRVYVRADKMISIDSHIAKVLSPVERLLGVTLLGSTTYNSIAGRGFGFNN
jgi:polysaccharide export outer membrane protein